MTSGQRTDERPSAELVETVLDLFGVSITATDQAYRGEESIGWRGSSPKGERFVQLFPPWRAVDDLAWCDTVARAAATTAPQCAHAYSSIDGRVVITTPEGPVMVFPFIEGSHPAPRAPITFQASRLLAAMHRGLVSAWSGVHPVSQRNRFLAGNEPVATLVDDELDLWERSLDLQVPAFPIHGDFYAGNLLAEDDRITGVVDWWDAELAQQEQEVSWATWEFCQNDDAVDLVDEEAEAFLEAYVDAGGPAPVRPPFDPIPWIRRRLRREARTWYADPRSHVEVSPYHEAQLVAFERLRGRRLPGR